MESLFFSPKNIDKLAENLGNSLNIRNTPDSQQACRKFLQDQMKVVYSKYGERKPSKIAVPDYIRLLNEKSIKECMRLYQEKKQKKDNVQPQRQNQDYGQMNMARDRDLYGDRNRGEMQRPQHTSGMRQNNGFPGMIDGGGAAYASFNANQQFQQGGYITATGEMGAQMNMGGNNEMYSKKDSTDDIERRMMERQNDYVGKPSGGFGGGFGNNMMGGMMGGMNGGMMSRMQDMNNINYNPLNMNNQGKPPEINFALDGGDTRRTKEKEMLQQQAQNMMGGMDGGMFSGFDMGGMGNMAGFDMGMGMNGMGNMGMQNMNGMGNNMMNNNMMNNNMMNNNMMNNNMMGNMNNMGMNGMGNNMMNNNMMGNMNNMNGMNNNMGNMNNNMGMNNMNQNNLSSTQMSEAEMKAKLNNIMAERNNIQVSTNQPFNPMVSPNQKSMQQTNNIQQMLQQQQQLMSGNNNFNNQQNFLKGGRVGIPDFSNMKQEDIQKYISNIKSEITNSLNVDYRNLQNMSSKQISKLINKLKNPDSNQLDEISIEKPKKKEKKDLQSIINELKELKKTSKSVSFEEDKEEKVDNKKKQKKEKENKSNNSFELNSQDYTEPEYYNDYMVELPSDIRRFNTIEILDYNLPKTYKPIDDDSCKLFFLKNNQELEIELPTGVYSIDDIIEGIQNTFDNEDINLKIIKIEDYITIKSTDDHKFIMECSDDFGKLLGFRQDKYENSNEYTSEEKHNIITTLYLYIKNLDTTQKDIYLEIDLLSKNKNSQLKLDNSATFKNNEMIITFKRRKTSEEDLVDFNNKPHTIKFNFR